MKKTVGKNNGATTTTRKQQQLAMCVQSPENRQVVLLLAHGNWSPNEFN